MPKATKRRNRVRIFIRGDRGFHGYGRPFRDSYGSEIEVYESSSGRHVWLKVDPRSWDRNIGAGEACAHLDERQAREVIARLERWLEDRCR